MRKFVFVLLLLALLYSNAVEAQSSTVALLRQRGAEASLHLPAFAIAQLIEILKQEVSLLQSLLTNMKSRQEISAQAYIVVNLADNSVLLQKNSNQSYPIASVTKLMTAVISLGHTLPQETITLTPEMLKPLGYSPSLYLGLSVSAANLLKASLIQSANDAAQSLSHFVGKQKFIQIMNQKAEDLGMANTIFYDAHGLSPNNRSTASDLAKLLTYIHQNHPEILETTKNNDFWLPDRTGTLLKFQNVNNFYPLSDFVGGKTGYLPEAKQTMAGVFDVNGKATAIVVLHSQNRQADLFAILRQLEN